MAPETRLELPPVERGTERVALEQVNRLGHVVAWDPPHSLSSVSRWTCSKCGRAVLRYGTHVYGSAMTERCGQDAP